MTPQSHEAGFSLVEALVALLIMAIATVGLVRATESHIDSVRALELRSAAQWVAENSLVEAMVPGAEPPSQVEMLGRNWEVTTRSESTTDPDLRSVTVSVRPSGADGPVATLTGFADLGSTTR